MQNQRPQQQSFLTGAILYQTKYCVAIATQYLRLKFKSPALQCQTCNISYHPTCAKMPQRCKHGKIRKLQCVICMQTMHG